MVSADKPEKLDELPQITDEDFQYIEAAAGIKSPNLHFRDQLARCKERSARWEPDYSNIRPKVLREAARQLSEHAEHLLHDLNYRKYRGDDQSERDLALAYQYLWDCCHGVGEAFVQELHRLAENAELTLEVMWPDKRGRSPNARFEMLIYCLADLYEKVTGRAAGVSQHEGLYQGPFFLFVEACLRRLELSRVHSNEALGKALQRQLRRRREHYGMDRT